MLTTDAEGRGPEELPIEGSDHAQTQVSEPERTPAACLLAMGVDPRTIMQTLGHSQISLTMNTDTHVLPSLLVEAAAKMNAILGAE